MDIMVQVGTKLPYQTLKKVEQFARDNDIVHNSSGKVNNAEAVRRLVELALDAQVDSSERDDLVAVGDLDVVAEQIHDVDAG